MDDGKIGWHKDTTVFAGGGESKTVVIFIDGPAHGTETVVAVGEHIGKRKLRKAARACRLNNAHIGDVMRGKGIKA